MAEILKHVLVTGGAGYVGSALVPQLLDEGYCVTVYDILYFGDAFLPKGHPRLSVVQGDIRDTDKFASLCRDVEAVIHLACISNDASFELDEALSTSINLNAFEPMVLAAKRAGVRRFIYASTSSVYGVSNAARVTEDHPLLPLTLYNKYKGLCEPQLLRHCDNQFVGVIVRPATVCGVAPRQRLDLTVNILTNHAFHNGKILVYGGTQLRPNIHIADITRLYRQLLREPAERIQGETFNCGYENASVAAIAEQVKMIVEQEYPDKAPIHIETVPSDDSRSYHIDSSKIQAKLNFKPEHSIGDAVRDLCKAFGAGAFPDSFDNSWYYNVRHLKALEAA